MQARHILSVTQFTKPQILAYIVRATQFKKKGNQPHKKFPEKTILNVFYEPSTRTSCSFQAAAIRLGCNVISITDKYSSVEKGETLEDTIKTLNYYGDSIVLRHPNKGAARMASLVSNIPIINAGDGNGEHPTQALLDIFTIYTELQKNNIELDNVSRSQLTVTFVGDLKNSRTIHSLIHILVLFPNIRFVYIAPPTLEMPEEIVEKINSLNNIQQITTLTLEAAISITDILYVTRIQKERFSNVIDYYNITLNHNFKNYCITKRLLEFAKPTTLIMHPLPRTSEIDPVIDNDPRAVYFTQVENGVYMRMAILEDIFS